MYDKKKQTNANKVLNYTCMVHVYLECLAEHLFNSRRHRRTPSPLPPPRWREQEKRLPQTPTMTTSPCKFMPVF